MMYLLILLIWYAIGGIACYCGLYFEYRRGADVSLNDILLSIAASLLGPIMIVFLLCYVSSQINPIIIKSPYEKK